MLEHNVYNVGFTDAASKREWLYQKESKLDISEFVTDFYDNVMKPRGASHGLKDFIIQSENGEFKYDKVLSYLNGVGGDIRNCCAGTPEVIVFLESSWGMINSMATAMLINIGYSGLQN